MKSIKYVAEDGQWCGRKKREAEGEEDAEGQEVSASRLGNPSEGGKKMGVQPFVTPDLFKETTPRASSLEAFGF